MKKLKALLKFSGVQGKKPIKKLLRFYGIIGILRNGHLQQQRIRETYQARGQALPDEYLYLLNKEGSEQIILAQRLMKGRRGFKKEQRRAIAALSLRRTGARTHAEKFVQARMTEIRDLLAPSFPTDDDLHSIRKSLKTLLYTVPFMPIQFHPAGSLKSLADLLGELQDLHIGINYLLPAYLDRVSDEKERADLRLLREEWQEEKYQKQQQVYAWLKQRWAMTAVVTGEQ